MAKHESIAEQTGYGVTVIKEKIKKMMNEGLIQCKKSERVKDEKGKYNTLPNTYCIVEEKVDMSKLDEYKVKLPEKYYYKNKEYSVTELRNDIINKGNIYHQHYFYAHEYKDDDPIVYKLFCESMEILKKNKFDFSKMEAAWDNYQMEKLVKKEREDKDNPVNGVRLKGESDFVILNENNVDEIDFEDVEDVYYYNGTVKNDAKFVKIAGLDVESKEELERDRYDFIVDRYKQLIKSGKLATSDELMKIREAI
jgi:hypothetical protein